jgi:choice-of-anchor A domain-containing protein
VRWAVDLETYRVGKVETLSPTRLKALDHSDLVSGGPVRFTTDRERWVYVSGAVYAAEANGPFDATGRTPPAFAAGSGENNALLIRRDRRPLEALPQVVAEMDRASAYLAGLAKNTETRLAFGFHRLPGSAANDATADLAFIAQPRPRGQVNVFEVRAAELSGLRVPQLGHSKNILFRGSRSDVVVINVLGKLGPDTEGHLPRADVTLEHLGIFLQGRNGGDQNVISPRNIVFNFVDAETVFHEGGGMADDVRLRYLKDAFGLAVGLPGTFLAPKAIVTSRNGLFTGAVFARAFYSDPEGVSIGGNAIHASQINGYCLESGLFPSGSGIGCGPTIPGLPHNQ